jgi:hypothetical protein
MDPEYGWLGGLLILSINININCAVLGIDCFSVRKYLDGRRRPGA